MSNWCVCVCVCAQKYLLLGLSKTVGANPNVFSGASIVILRREGTPVCSHAAGNIGVEIDEPRTTHLMIRLASAQRWLELSLFDRQRKGTSSILKILILSKSTVLA